MFPDVSIIIPARDEPYLQKTIDRLLCQSRKNIEIIAVLDGYWPVPSLVDNKQLHIIHFSESKGMRRAINAGASIARGKYLMKVDAHCDFCKAFDEKLMADCEENWTVVPIRYELDQPNWCRDKKKKHEFQYIRKGDLKGRDWPEYAQRVEGKKIVDLMTSQGSFWFMHKAWFDKFGGLDDVNYGSMGREAQEVCLKTWFNGGRYVLNRNTWYAHWNKPGSLRHMSNEAKLKSLNQLLNDFKDIQWLVDKFAPVPTW